MSSSQAAQGVLITGSAQRDDLNALMWALALELLLIGLAIAIYATGILHPHPTPKDLVTLQLNSLATEPMAPVPPPPKKVVKTPLPEKKVATPPPEPIQLPPESVKLPVAQDTTPSPFAEQYVPPPPAPAPSRTEADVLSDYTAKIRAAVQAALIFPRAAEELRFAGRTRVEFRLQQAQPSKARVIVSSGINLFDRAALQAVQDAVYPPPPEALRDQSRVFQIWIEFKR